MLSLSKLVAYLDELLTPHLYRDFCPNGLQVSGVEKVDRIITGVSANKLLAWRHRLNSNITMKE